MQAIAQYEAILKDQPNSLVAINNLVSLLLDYRSDKESLDRAFSLADALKNSNVPQFQDTLRLGPVQARGLQGLRLRPWRLLRPSCPTWPPFIIILA